MRDRACEEAAAAEECPGGLGGDGEGPHQGVGGGHLNGNARFNGANENEEKRGAGKGRDAGWEEEERRRTEREAMMEDGRVSLAFSDELGMVEVTELMHVYRHHAGAQERGSIALRRLAISDSQFLKTDKRAHKVIKTVVKTVLEAMAAHLAHPGVQGQACATLSEFTRERGAGVTVARFGGVRRVLLAMTAHEDDGEVQERACAALASMANNTHSNKLKIVQSQGCECVVAAMRTHSDKWNVQTQGCAVLCVIAFSSHELLLRVKAAGADPVIDRIAAHHAAASCSAAAPRTAMMLRDKLRAAHIEAPQ
jgi:hypothetical protein